MHLLAGSLYLATAFGSTSQNNKDNSIIELLQFITVIGFIFQPLSRAVRSERVVAVFYSSLYLQRQEVSGPIKCLRIVSLIYLTDRKLSGLTLK